MSAVVAVVGVRRILTTFTLKTDAARSSQHNGACVPAPRFLFPAEPASPDPLLVAADAPAAAAHAGGDASPKPAAGKE